MDGSVMLSPGSSFVFKCSRPASMPVCVTLARHWPDQPIAKTNPPSPGGFKLKNGSQGSELRPPLEPNTMSLLLTTSSRTGRKL